ncbi:histidine phosphatase family protein [Fontisubflavum oceani]|uniref:histidine phosphatase family protein n=1 Tax=Fontisubflavum oceani TaxID=2978973 RepID=UPI0025B2FA83|nr:histidine phosphatase family protein [Fontisubflavum oceani]WJY22215.1 histidine phosphatase family protein [Fontisubflavum oceani]
MRAMLTPALIFTLIPFAGNATENFTPQELVRTMQDGGVVIFIRHATTETDYADQVTADPLDCSTQRTLSEDGWHEAVQIGESFAYFDIPVGEVISSQYCRAWQTAWLAFGAYEMNPGLNFAPAEEYTDAQIAEMREGMLGVMLPELAFGENRILVGHDDPFEAATGVYPEPMGVTYVLRHDGQGGLQMLGHIIPDRWPGR